MSFSNFLGRQNSRIKRRKNGSNKFTFEKLEPRLTLSGTVLNGNELTIFGDAEANTGRIDSINATTLRVTLTGISARNFNTADVQKIIFIGFDGNDNFTNGTTIPSLLLGNGGDDTLRGGKGADTINGGPGNDSINGDAGDDRLVGFDGDDTILGSNGNDSIFGGDGLNNLDGQFGDDIIYGGNDADIIDGDAGRDQIFGLAGDDMITSGSGGVAGTDGTGQADLVLGLDGNDTIIGSSGLDVFYGGRGDDILIGGSGENRQHGQDGDDQLTGGSRADFLSGNNGNDVINGLGAADIILGGNNDDIINGGSGNDIIRGENGNDILRGGDGADTITGGNQNDSLYGDGGVDNLQGEAGNDGLFGGIASSEVLRGGSGSDRFLVFGSDRAADAAGADVVLTFRNGGSNWSDNEIFHADAGLRALHNRTGATVVFKDSLASGEVPFVKVPKGSLGNNIDGENELSWSASWEPDGTIISETYTRQIKIADWNESLTAENEVAALTMIHEIGHSWDSTEEIAARFSGSRGIWNSFLARSGWASSNPGAGHTRAGQTQEPFDRVYNTAAQRYEIITRNWWRDNGAEFARNYGTTSPKEDWGTVWESLFIEEIVENPNGSHSDQIPNKVALVNSLLNLM
ncbi:MAG: hypothetical protein AB8B55_17850 [Mariniblastus sp.]